MNTPTVPADDARQGLDEIIAGVNRVCASLAGVVTNATRAVEEQHARVAAAEQRAETAIRDAGIYRDRLTRGMVAHGKEATRANQAEKRAHDAEQALRDLRGVTDTDRAEKAEAELRELHDALGLAPGQLHSAALSAIHGRSANIRELTARAELAEHRATQWEAARHAWQAKAQEIEADRDMMEDSRDSAIAAREQAETDRDRAREQRHTWARQADAEILEHRQRAEQAERLATKNREHADRLAEQLAAAEQRANRAERDASRAEAALARVRNSRTTIDAWAALGSYYHLTATEAGRLARRWRTTAERHAQRAENDVNEIAEHHERHRRNLAAVFALPAETPFEDIYEYAGKTLNRSGERLLAGKARADRFEAAWQNARLRAKQAKAREQLARDRAERYRQSRNHWTHQALDAAALNNLATGLDRARYTREAGR